MAWFALFDPASLSLWYDTSNVTRYRDGERVANTIYNAVYGENEAIERVISELAEADSIRHALIASMIWHEQRHFIDMVLTNYGQWRLRQFSSLYANAGAIIDSARRSDGTLVIPLDAYTDPVRRALLGVHKADDTLLAYGKDVLRRVKYIEDDNARFLPHPSGAYAVGGHAQLESMAFIFQMGAVQRRLGVEMSMQVQDLLYQLQGDLRQYNWPMTLPNVLGLSSEEVPNGNLSNVSAIPAILLACLATRERPGVLQETDSYGRQADGRLFRILEYSDRHHRRLAQMDALECWDHLSGICSKLFGASPLEEIEADLASDEANLDRIVGSGLSVEIKDYFRETFALRTRLVDMLRTKPESLLDPDYYSDNVLDGVKPLPVQVFPSGSDLPAAEGHVPIFNYYSQEKGGTAWTWGTTPAVWDTCENQISLSNLGSWRSVIEGAAPLAKLLVRGFNHAEPFGPELVKVMFEVERELDLALLFEPGFRGPSRLVESASWLFEITGASSLKCDWCSAQIGRDSARLLSPWYFRMCNSAAAAALDRFGRSGAGYDSAVRDWSDWLFCLDCLRELPCQAMLAYRAT